MSETIRASRRRVPRSRGAMSGFLLLLLGAWAAFIPMFGPYLDVAYTPFPNDAWHWTAARGWLEVLPGGVVILGGLLLLVSASRAMTLVGGWLAAAGGAWLIVGPPLADAINVSLGGPEPEVGINHQAFDALVMFYGVGAVILFLAAAGLGRLSVVSVRDMQAAERRAAEQEVEVAATTSYPPAQPVRASMEEDDIGRHRGDVPAMQASEQPTTTMAQPTYTAAPSSYTPAPPPPRDES